MNIAKLRLPNDIDKLVGRNVKLARRSMGYSGKFVASQINLSFQQLYKCERGENRLSAGKLWHISKVLGKPVEWFFKEHTLSEIINLM